MNLIRWIVFLPLAATVSIALGIGIASISGPSYFSRDNIWQSLFGLAPLFASRALPVATFIYTASVLCPKRNKPITACIALFGGIFGFPFGDEYFFGVDGYVFYGVEVAGVMVGVGVGIMITFLSASRKAARGGRSNSGLH